MGEFLGVSAFRDRSVDDVVRTIQSYMASHGVACEVVTSGSTEEALDALVFAPNDGWTIVLWPPYFNINDVPLCESVSRDLGGLASTVHVYDGDYWTHVLFDRGERIDQFASAPDYFAEGDEEAKPLIESWAGNADRLGEALGKPSRDIDPYLVRVDFESELGKAFADDAFALDDFWVFTDMWRRMGIVYPEDLGEYQTVLRLSPDFTEKLPTSDL